MFTYLRSSSPLSWRLHFSNRRRPVARANVSHGIRIIISKAYRPREVSGKGFRPVSLFFWLMLFSLSLYINVDEVAIVLREKEI